MSEAPNRKSEHTERDAKIRAELASAQEALHSQEFFDEELAWRRKLLPEADLEELQLAVQSVLRERVRLAQLYYQRLDPAEMETTNTTDATTGETGN